MIDSLAEPVQQQQQMSANHQAPAEMASWLELESDPGLFTLLIDDLGVKGVQVEEIYDLSKPLDSSIFGFVFLFKWASESKQRTSGRRGAKSAGLEPNSNYVTEPSIVNNIFFAHQVTKIQLDSTRPIDQHDL